jgi:hypothetical protein
MRLLLCALPVVLACGSLPAQEKKFDAKINLDYLEKTFHLKGMDVQLQAKKKKGKQSNPHVILTLLLEFTQDTDVKEVQDAFANTDNPKLWVYLFDGDNVLLKRYPLTQTQGEITGVKGDAFRALTYLETQPAKNARKIEVRPAVQKK